MVMNEMRQHFIVTNEHKSGKEKEQNHFGPSMLEKNRRKTNQRATEIKSRTKVNKSFGRDVCISKIPVQLF